MKLTYTERWILVNQYRILLALDPKEKDYYEKAIEVLSCGYENEYEGLDQRIYPDSETMTEGACEEVLEILTMYQMMTYAWKEYGEEAGIEETELIFPGFDGNNEAGYLSYMMFFCDSDGGKFTMLKFHKDRNSHFPTLDMYRRMYKAWKSSKEPNALTVADLKRILAAKHKHE